MVASRLKYHLMLLQVHLHLHIRSTDIDIAKYRSWSCYQLCGEWSIWLGWCRRSRWRGTKRQKGEIRKESEHHLVLVQKLVVYCMVSAFPLCSYTDSHYGRIVRGIRWSIEYGILQSPTLVYMGNVHVVYKHGTSSYCRTGSLGNQASCWCTTSSFDWSIAYATCLLYGTSTFYQIVACFSMVLGFMVLYQ